MIAKKRFVEPVLIEEASLATITLALTSGSNGAGQGCDLCQ